MSSGELPMEVRVTSEGRVWLDIEAERHGWTVETLVENSRTYTGDGVEAVSTGATCFVGDPSVIRDLADRLRDAAERMECDLDTHSQPTGGYRHER